MKNAENNKIIAKFMGIRVMIGDNNGKKYYYYNNAERQDYEALPDYDTSWDALMQVVKKINKSGKPGGIRFDLFDSLGNANLEKAYEYVVKFINWYNSKKKEEEKARFLKQTTNPTTTRK